MSSLLDSDPPSLVDAPALIGGAPCLDFANTVDDRTDAKPLDYLTSYPALLAWSLYAGVLSSTEASRLQELARKEPARAEAARTIFLGIEALFLAICVVMHRGERHDPWSTIATAVTGFAALTFCSVIIFN